MLNWYPQSCFTLWSGEISKLYINIIKIITPINDITIKDSDLFPIFFIWVNPVQIFLPKFVFNLIFTFPVHYPLILKRASYLLKLFILLFIYYRLVKIITKSFTQHLQIHFFNINDKKFPVFEFLFSYCINRLILAFLRLYLAS